jgi:hypothetical protein
MAGMAPIVVPGAPHHVTQRGVGSLNIFQRDEDRRFYSEFVIGGSSLGERIQRVRGFAPCYENGLSLGWS